MLEKEQLPLYSPYLFKIYISESIGMVIGHALDLLKNMGYEIPCLQCQLVRGLIRKANKDIPGIQLLIENQLNILGRIDELVDSSGHYTESKNK